jgi:serine protease Do
MRRRALVGAGAAGVAAAALGWRGAAAQDLVAVAAAVRASILPVGTFSATDSPRFGFRGTGFVLGDGNHVATNFHVLPPAAEIDGNRRLVVAVPQPTSSTSASGNNAELRGASVVASDRARDLALLKIDGTPLPALKLGAPGAAREGQAIAIVGFPVGGVFGFSPVIHRGIIASITRAALPAPTAQSLDPRAISRLREGNFEVFQLDATAYPGNSGGPLLDAASGEVLGVINMVLVRGSRETALSNPTGITYAIPVRHLHELMAGR